MTPPFLLSLLLLLLLTTIGASLALEVTASQPIVICGAGPAALVFARRFLHLTANTTSSTTTSTPPRVILLEKRPRPLRYSETKATSCEVGDNAFGFGLSSRSQLVLSKTEGLVEKLNAISQPTKFAGSIELRLINRRELCAELLYELEQEFGGKKDQRLTICFDTEMTDITDDRAVIVRSNGKEAGKRKAAEKSLERIDYSLLIAADGANSIVRSKLIEGGYLQCERYYAPSTWKALQLPEQPNLDPSAFARYPKPFHKPHKFIKRDNGAILPRFPNRHVMLNFRGSTDMEAAQYPFDARTPDELKIAISKMNSNVTNFPSDDVLQSFLDQRPGLEAYMKLNRHYVPERNVVLVGDAAVGMYSLFGQGAANAMVHADRLAQTLADTYHHISTSNSDSIESSIWTRARTQASLQEYSANAVEEGHAISDLNLLTHSLRKKGPIKLWAGLQMMGIGKTLSAQPEMKYGAILRKWRISIWISKFFWRRTRRVAPPVAIASKTRNDGPKQ